MGLGLTCWGEWALAGAAVGGGRVKFRVQEAKRKEKELLPSPSLSVSHHHQSPSRGTYFQYIMRSAGKAGMWFSGF